jgi:cell division protease FtsH
MSDRLGPISFDSSAHSIFIGRDFSQTKSYSEETAAIIDEEVKRIFDEASEICARILREHGDLLKKVADYLLANESMDGADFEYLCEHNELPPAKEGKGKRKEALPSGQSEPSAEEEPFVIDMTNEDDERS